MVVAQADDAAPSKPLRVNFIPVSLLGASSRLGAIFGRTVLVCKAAQRRRRPCRTKTAFRPARVGNTTKPFSGTRETAPKQTGRNPIANKAAHRRQEAQMNHSIHSADRATHLKIVIMALVAGILVAGVSIAARTGTSDDMQTARVIKAGKPTMVTSSDTMLIR
jgi:hypothetical protein